MVQPTEMSNIQSQDQFQAAVTDLFNRLNKAKGQSVSKGEIDLTEVKKIQAEAEKLYSIAAQKSLYPKQTYENILTMLRFSVIDGAKNAESEIAHAILHQAKKK